MQLISILSSPAAGPHLYESDVADAVAVAEAGAGDRGREAGALAGSLVVAALIAADPRERDSAIGAVLASGMGISILLPGYTRASPPRRPTSCSATSSGSPAASC